MKTLEAQIYTDAGKTGSKINLPEDIFGLPWNADLVHQVVVAMEANKRVPVAHTKDRGEVSGGGKKPWRQKGTGRARHGSSRSPIWRGGGITHGPRNDRDFSQKINKKMKAKALSTIFSEKYKKGEVLFVQDFTLPEAKTKSASAIISNLSSVSGFEKLKTKRANAFAVVLPGADKAIGLSFRNIKKGTVANAASLSPVDAIKYKYLIFVRPEETVEALSKRLILK